MLNQVSVYKTQQILNLFMKRFFLCFSFFAACIGLANNTKAQKLMRYPCINADGTLISFSYQGDIWTVPAAGGTATRLTVHEGYEAYPRFSPDGKTIAFSGARYGNADLFTIPIQGGQPQRLTYHSAADVISNWTTAAGLLFSTSREFRQIERPQEIFSIDPTGGTEKRIAGALGYEPAASPNGRFVAFVRGDINPVARKDYKGSSARTLWIYDTKNNTYHQLPAFATNNILPQWGSNTELYFLSSSTGEYNLYKMLLNDMGKQTGKTEAITNYSTESIRYYSLSADGKQAVIEKDLGLYLVQTATKNTSKINVQLFADDRLDAEEYKILNTGASDLSLSPSGKLMAFTLRGDVFVKEVNKDIARTVNISEHAYRDFEPAWLNDSALVFTSDREGSNFDLYVATMVSDSNGSNLYSGLRHNITRLTNTPEDESKPVFSHNRKKIAYTHGRGNLLVADIDNKGKLSNQKTLIESWAPANNVSWSPDDLWLAYEQTDLYFNSEIFIHAADNSSKPVNVSMHPRSDGSPYWSPDGSKLAFISERSYNSGSDIYFVWLKQEDWEKQQQDWDEPGDTKLAGDTAKTKTKKVKTVKIDFDKIYERSVQVTGQPGNEGNLVISDDGETFYYSTGNSAAKGHDLYSVKWNGKDLKEITKGGTNPTNVMLDGSGKFLYYQKSSGFARMDVKTASTDNLPYQAKMKINYAEERKQIFEEAWRTIRDGFYDPNMHGVNWKAMHDKYEDRIVQASTTTDFTDMFNLMLGELNSSHMGLSAPPREQTNRETTGLLGAELTPTDKGMLVKKVFNRTPASRQNSRLQVGDIITSVNGQQYNKEQNFYAFLNQTGDDKIILGLSNGKEVIIRPATSQTEALYDDFIAGRQQLVDQYSNGRLGYVHIKSMDFPSFEKVERAFTIAGQGKDGLVIDVRYNGGGSTTDYLMAILNYKQHAYTIPRGAAENLEKEKLKFRNYYPTGERLVYAAWTKPSIAICNEGSYSNAEIFSHAYKTLGIGTLVGTPTNGSVISTGARTLLDGSTVRLPFRGWYTKATNQNQELGPAVPDIIVENDVDWMEKNTDKQLQVAVSELLKQIGAKN